MARRPRNSRAWRFVLSGVRRDQDARSPTLPAEEEAWGYDSDGQHSNSDSDTDLLHLPPSIPSAVPVTGESYCDCDSQNDPYCSSLHTFHQIKSCQCGEEDNYFDWVWDDCSKSTATVLSCDNRKVSFHMEYSCGTAAIRGNRMLTEGQHFWEIKMTSPVYGTDMMVGIGTSDVNLDKYRHTFCSLLGKDAESWGLSYTGKLWPYTVGFAHLARNKKLFPMVCSTAAKSSMKVIRSCCCRTSLQYLCCARLRQLLPDSVDSLEVLPLPPGLKQVLGNKLGWVLQMGSNRSNQHKGDTSATTSCGSDSDSSCTPGQDDCQRKRCRRI
uniref:SPRY domain-containing SOCS box protein 3 n=1 Tax=Xenopus tropicalis TaxID=8364 RepID=A0A6I8RP82_XENTR